jgi:FlaA1/EpsC-like NDP-sugar epimerase
MFSSSDKAVNPTSTMGVSKLMAEKLMSAADAHRGGARTIFTSTRFGNVSGSRGSVIPLFAEQIAAGGPITVTDPEVTRYFMTVQEAVQLVIQAAAIGRDGEALVLEMGKPVRIAQVARQMAEQASAPVDIVYTGLRPGEKLHEELFGDGERDTRPFHPLISHVAVPTLHPYEARLLTPYGNPGRLVQDLARMCEGPVAGRTPVHIGRQVGRPAGSRSAVASRVAE